MSHATAALEELRQHLRTTSGLLPSEFVVVQARLIRTVGHGELAGIGRVFVKVMCFPRLRDQIRYVHRALPALHEAAMLRRLRAADPDLPCPEVVDAWGDRRLRVPRLSVLVTRALPVATTPHVGFADRVALAARLARSGVLHPDLHTDNFVRLTDGRAAILDLQSAALRPRPLGPAARRRMAVRLMHGGLEEDGDPELLVAAGLLRAADLDSVVAAAHRSRSRALARMILRCGTESTRFEVRRGLSVTRYARRRLDGPASNPLGTGSNGDLVPVPVGRLGIRLWIGDSASEILDGRPPLLRAMERKSWWHPGVDRVYIPAADDPQSVTAAMPRLLRNHRRARDLARGRQPSEETLAGAAATPVSGSVPGCSQKPHR